MGSVNPTTVIVFHIDFGNRCIYGRNSRRFLEILFVNGDVYVLSLVYGVFNIYAYFMQHVTVEFEGHKRVYSLLIFY